MNIALVGNPNSGKSSLFNSLTGLNQKVGNFPGVTVDKKTGTFILDDDLTSTVIDLPGTYSLYPRRDDEWVAYKVLMHADKQVNAEVILLIADASNLKRNLLFCSQVIDLKYPVVIALTMMDIASKKGIEIDVNGLSRELGVPVIPVNPRKNKGITELKKTLAQTVKKNQSIQKRDFINNQLLAADAIEKVKHILPGVGDYEAIHYLINHENFGLPQTINDVIEQAEIDNKFNPSKTQAEEIVQRYKRIKQVMQQNVVEPDPLQRKLFTENLDNLLLHRVWGYAILLIVLFFLFQSIFWLAQYPMNGIDWSFSQLSGWLNHVLPTAWWSDLIVNGLIAGLNGILVFV
ncbi:MAG: FeoB small GTPase domain-containing protein, partial [Parafilimonas sp.]